MFGPIGALHHVIREDVQLETGDGELGRDDQELAEQCKIVVTAMSRREGEMLPEHLRGESFPRHGQTGTFVHDRSA